jgi:hypothetical protein
MVQETVSIIDKLIALLERRERRQKAVFTELISPMFDELLFVHKDYIAMFHAVLHRLETPCNIEDLVKLLIGLRRELEPLRGKLSALANRLEAEEDDSDEFKFAACVVYYFTEHGSFNTGTASRGLIQELGNVGVSWSKTLAGSDLARVETTVHDCINRLRSTWSTICIGYADLKLASTRIS